LPFAAVRAACTNFVAKNVELTKEDKEALVKILEFFPQKYEYKRVPLHSESDADDNWRVSSSSSVFEPIDNLPPTLHYASYIPPMTRRGNYLVNLADNNKENRYQKNNNKRFGPRKDRSPSPDNWRK
jgi:hypothetical protein